VKIRNPTENRLLDGNNADLPESAQVLHSKSWPEDTLNRHLARRKSQRYQLGFN
jgi:hypothetical protein